MMRIYRIANHDDASPGPDVGSGKKFVLHSLIKFTLSLSLSECTKAFNKIEKLGFSSFNAIFFSIISFVRIVELYFDLLLYRFLSFHLSFALAWQTSIRKISVSSLFNLTWNF